MSIPREAWLVVAAIGAVALLATAGRRAVAAVGEAVNPTSDGNVFYSGVNALGDAIDDGNKDESFSLGAWLYDVTHRDPDL